MHHYVGPSIDRSIGRKSLRFFRCLELKGDHIWVTAPAHPHATDAAVYTALFLFALHFPFFFKSLNEPPGGPAVHLEASRPKARAFCASMGIQCVLQWLTTSSTYRMILPAPDLLKLIYGQLMHGKQG